MSPKKSAIRTLLVACVVMAMAAPATIVQAAGEHERLQQTRNEIAAIKKRLSSKKANAAAVRSELNNLDAKIAELNRQIASGEHDISTLEADIRSSEAKIGELEAEYQAALGASNERARSIYMNGPIDTVRRLFEAQSLGDFIRVAVWWEVAAELDEEVMLKANRIKGGLEERKTKLTSIKSDLDAQRRWLSQRRALIAEARGERQKALNAINAEIASEERHIRQLEAQSRQLQAVISARLSRSTGAVSRAGFIWPIRGRITSPYGWRRGGFHTGIDIDGYTGQPIAASKAGYVVGISCGSGYGICTLIDHGNGVSTLYAHQVRKAVYSGYVRRGQTIGYVGCTGWCTGSHLHFEVRVNGQPKNPRYFLP